MSEHRPRPHAKTLVLRSLESSDSLRCVDLFRRPDGTFGFEEYRRDMEDPRGWGPAGDFAGRVFRSEAQTLKAAKQEVGWLSALEDG